MANQNKIIVKARSANGFRRAGIAFTRDGVEVDPAKLKKGQLDAILNEPNLVVVGEVVAKPETAAEKKARETAEKKAAQEEADRLAAEQKAAADAAEAERLAEEQTASDKAGDAKGKAGK